MADRILLVQGDTLPSLVVSLYKDDYSSPMDLRGCTVRMRFREAGSDTVKAILIGQLLSGVDFGGTGVPSSDPPYDQADGRGGRVQFNWGVDDLDAEGAYEGEVEVTSASNLIQTVYDVVKFKVRSQF